MVSNLVPEIVKASKAGSVETQIKLKGDRILTVIRLAHSEGRITKWRELYSELTPRDLTILEAYAKRSNRGATGALDLVEASMTSILAAAFNGSELNSERARELRRGPLKAICAQRQVMPEVAASMMEPRPGKPPERTPVK